MIRFTRWITRTAATALVAVAATSAFAQGSADKVVRIGYQKAGLLSVVKTQGSLETRLKPLGYTVQWFEFPAGPQLLEALNANSIDFGYTGAPPPVFAQAAGVRFVYVAAEPPSPHNEAVFVKADSPVRSLADLRGKKVALQKGSSANYLLLEALKKAGVRYDEIHPVYLPPADARAAFESGNVDAWAVWDPYYAAAQNSLKIRTLSDYTGLTPANNFYEATRGFAEQHADVVGTILKQLRETGLWVNGHPAETAALIAPKVGLPQPLVETWIKRVPFGAVPVDEKIVAVQQGVADAFHAAKLIPQKLNVADNAWTDKGVASALAAK
ncbi:MULTISPECIES: sulfonate ABC transporter substrate-binding protein [unclassified Burkholderia]|uniref:sulfonate ABC transporter substrate-binding protein n=1 Tax=unclassified Burkholderia TaxID=2613784 RepID=UPI000F57698F|nr:MULTISPECIES: sulfonate ABC transporter substrate-binding protein [unclassified Burkholderia]RQR43408.1 sulfonate ABC transporter substrate-binding protein [Burkholderia sp. Bp9131]RQR74280.1 sulfonate ABC transporter substrate-binding protein [Burkholderia sp. Bp9015]RQS01166.1 sulfonate ABC transporter substrate-binding protein [Burkholderia sp. Bp8994]RQS28156.1 sulfonate ABC transporter substrate-binding protein [Burkholderia sp. Bp8995]RQS38776.1 sulfonate ABC transporter substrate-bin